MRLRSIFPVLLLIMAGQAANAQTNSRLFRDVVGWINQAVAGGADRVVWTVAGIPVTVKGAERGPAAR